LISQNRKRLLGNIPYKKTAFLQQRHDAHFNSAFDLLSIQLVNTTTQQPDFNRQSASRVGAKTAKLEEKRC